jgi:hypothetical protein
MSLGIVGISLELHRYLRGKLVLKNEPGSIGIRGEGGKDDAGASRKWRVDSGKVENAAWGEGGKRCKVFHSVRFRVRNGVGKPRKIGGAESSFAAGEPRKASGSGHWLAEAYIMQTFGLLSMEMFGLFLVDYWRRLARRTKRLRNPMLVARRLRDAGSGTERGMVSFVTKAIGVFPG